MVKFLTADCFRFEMQNAYHIWNKSQSFVAENIALT